MNRTVLSGLAFLLLVPGLALAQEGRGRRGPPRPDGEHPPGVRRMERHGPESRPVPEHAIKRLAAALTGLSKRVDRLEKGFQSLVQRLRQAHQDAPARPAMRDQARQGRRRGAAARGPRGMRGTRGMQPRAHRGMRRGPGDMRRMLNHPRVRAMARDMRGRMRDAYPMLKKALKSRMAGRRGGPHAAPHRGPDSRGPGAHGMRRPHAGPRGERRCSCGGAAAGKQAPARMTDVRRAVKVKEKVKAAKKAAAVRKIAGLRRAKSEKAAAPAPIALMQKARQLAAENAKLKAELKKLQAQMRKLMEAVRKRRPADR